MGSWGSGGHNRKRGYTAGHISLDSFQMAKSIPIKGGQAELIMRWDNGNSISVILCSGHLIASYSSEGEPIKGRICFDRVPNNYGGADRVYFSCPYCARRSRMLYCHNKRFKCRICARLNYVSQQTTKGNDLAIFKIRRMLREKFGVDPSGMAPCELDYYTPPKPKGMHWRTYERLMRELRRLQCDYLNEFVASSLRIIRGIKGGEYLLASWGLRGDQH